MDTAREIHTHFGFEKINALQKQWEPLQWHPNTDFEHFVLVCRHRPRVLAPCAVSVGPDNSCTAIVAARLEEEVFRPYLGYLKLPGIRCRRLAVLHGGVLGALDAAAVPLVLNALKRLAVDNRADVIWFNHLPETAVGLWDALQSKRSGSWRIVPLQEARHWELTLPKERGFLLARMRSKHRSWIKRKENEFAKAYPHAVQWHWYRHIESLERLCQQMEDVARTTYQRALGAGFVYDTLTHARLALFAQRGQLRVALWEVGGQPAAFWLGEVYRGVFHSAATGYLPSLRQYEIGTLMLLRMVDELVAEGIERLDFGLGDADYKRRFGDRSWREADAYLLSSCIRGRILFLYMKVVHRLEKLARQAMTRAPGRHAIKSVWRRRLVRR